MKQLLGVIEQVRQHTLTYGHNQGKVVPQSEAIVFASDDQSQVEAELKRRQAHARKNGGGGLMIHEAEWMRLKHASYRVAPVVAELLRRT